MRVKITKRWDAVKPKEVYPTTYQVGDVVDGDMAELALEVGAGVEETAMETKAAAPPSNVRATVKKNVDGFAEGAVVEGDEARELVAAGKAVLIKTKAGPSETK